MLSRLLRRSLAPYKTWLVAVVILGVHAGPEICVSVANADTDYILRTGGWMLLISLGQIVCSIVATFFGSRAAMSAGRDIRGSLFEQVQSCFSTGSGRHVVAFAREVVPHECHHAYFIINDQGQAADGSPITADNVAIKAKAGDNVLLRTIHAAYVPITYDFGSLDAMVIENDGRPLRTKIDLSGRRPQGEMFAIPWTDTIMRTASAERWSFLIQNVSPGVYPIELRFHQWITDKVEGVARTTLTVEA